MGARRVRFRGQRAPAWDVLPVSDVIGNRSAGPVRSSDGGFALLAVLLVLLALLVVTTPFLLSARNADRSSGRQAEERSARLALDSAARRARSTLGATHPALDTTPYWDSTDELEVTNSFDPAFYDASDPRGVMWDLDVEDLSGRIDLGSAPPHVLASAMGRASFLTRAVTPEDAALPAGRTTDFLEEGFVVVGGEVIHYGKRKGSAFDDLARGIGGDLDNDCGPWLPSAHAAGAPVLDLLAWSIAEWRALGELPLGGFGSGGNGANGASDTFVPAEPRTPASLEHLRQVVPALDGAALRALAAVTTVHGGVNAGPRWQHPTRLVTVVEPGQTCRIQLDSARWLAPGTTLRVSDGFASELAVVRTAQSGSIELTQALVNEYEEELAQIEVLARRPVNLNTASSRVIATLFEGVKFAGRNSRVTHQEALDLTEIVIESRPFEGFEDFLRRVLLPAAALEALPEDAPVVPEAFRTLQPGDLPEPLIDEDDAYALYTNGLNANDASLEFSTMPFAFTSREVFDLELRAAVNGSNGLERASAGRRDVQLVVPQGELLQVWSRQEDFEEELRLTRSAPWWTTGPENTSPYDSALGAVPPPRVPAHLGLGAEPVDPSSGAPPDPYVFPVREQEEGWARLWPARVHETGQPDLTRIEHFERERSDHEGRYVGEAPFVRDAGWAGLEASGLATAFSASFWVKPRAAGSGVLLDLGGGYQDSDRVALELTAEDLVLAVKDGAGDHPSTTFEEKSEVKVPRDRLPVDTWSHVTIDVRGNRPEQMTVLVDGMRRGESNISTRLSGSVDPFASFLPVESTEGFPDPCVLRIGDELVEARVSGGGFDASHNTTGDHAGFGGRWARERFRHQTSPTEMGSPGQNDALAFKFHEHPAGTQVTLYGYSVPAESNVPSGTASLPGPLGRFAVARATGALVDGDDGPGEPIIINFQLPTGQKIPIFVGYGLEGPDDYDVEAIRLSPVNDLLEAEDVAAAFPPGGGFALLIQRNLAYDRGDTLTVNGGALTGYEVIRYSSVQDGYLYIQARGPQHGLAKAKATGRAFVFQHSQSVSFLGGPNAGQPIGNFLGQQTFVIPISIHAPGASGQTAFLQPTSGSEFVQLTRQGSERDQTEWVRYDETADAHFVRSDDFFLEAARLSALSGLLDLEDAGAPAELDEEEEEEEEGDGPKVPSGPGTPGGPGQGVPGSGPGSGGAGGLGPALFATAVPAVGPRAQASGLWLPQLGQMESDYLDLPMTQAVASHLQFRGVMGTAAHAHPAGTQVLPVWKVGDPDMDAGVDEGHPGYGWPGALDTVMLVGDSPSDPGWPGRVHHAQRPREYLVTSWSEDTSDPLEAVADAEIAHNEHLGFDFEAVYLALDAPAAIPLVGGGANAATGSVDLRSVSRVTKFPSGELPRLVNTFTVGQNHQGGEIPPVVIDELVLSASGFYGSAGSALQGAALELALNLSDGALTLDVDPFAIDAGGRRRLSGASPLDALPQDGGLLRIGDEIVGYTNIDSSAGRFTLAPNGRGMLGTESRGHTRGELVTPLTCVSVSPIPGGVGATDALIPLEDTSDFPPMGLVRIEDELVHFVSHRYGGLWMPSAAARASESTGNVLGELVQSGGGGPSRGRGLFRGRFGTAAANHAADSLAVVVPFRYWDRWAPRANPSELGFFGVTAEQPGAYWREVLIATREPGLDGVRLGVLMRTDPSVAWDADPDVVDGLDLLDPTRDGGKPIPIGRISDRVEWRVFIEYLPGAYDPVDGLTHGWKATPRLEFLGVSYEAPGQLLSRIER